MPTRDATVKRLARPASIGTSPLAATAVTFGAGPGELVLEVGACAVCRTDLQIVEGDLAARRLPIVPGHQVVGRVVEVGEGVTGWTTGDRAAAIWLGWACGVCRYCTSGLENLCPEARFTGWDVDGGYATHVVVDARFAHRLPGVGDDAALAPLLCGGVIGHRALRLAGLRSGMRLGLYGFGASATLALQEARHVGASVHVATRNDGERRRAVELGAESVGGYDDPPPEPLDAAVTFAPAGIVVVAALRALAPGGTVVVNAIHLDGIPAFDYDLGWGERSMRSVANVTRADAEAFLRLATEIPVTTDWRAYPLTEANAALADLAAGRVGAAAAVLVP
jgi:propanol-preferring alcohol dehydrogenase